MTVGGLLEPADFFVLRTPLLSFDDFLNWGASDAPVAALDAVWREPQVGEAVFVATPELDAALERSQNAGATNDAAIRARRSLVAYFTRMCSRSTPFGLFAGCSVGTPGPHTRLELAPGGALPAPHAAGHGLFERTHSRAGGGFQRARQLALFTEFQSVPCGRSTALRGVTSEHAGPFLSPGGSGRVTRTDRHTRPRA